MVALLIVFAAQDIFRNYWVIPFNNPRMTAAGPASFAFVVAATFLQLDKAES